MSLIAVSAVAAITTASPSAGRLEAVAKREIERFEGAAESKLAAELFTPGYQLHFAGGPPMNLEGHQGVLQMFRAAFPDLSIKLLGQLVHGDRVANHFVMTGTHRGAFQGLPPTSKSFTVTGTNVMRFEGERIAELWGQLDMTGVLQQLGAIPSDGAPPTSAAPLVVGKDSGGSAVVRRFAEAFNRKDLDAIGREYSEDYVLDFPGGPRGRGVAGIRSATGEFMTAFPDLRFATDDLFEQGDRVVWRWTMTGTHQGQLGPFAKTGKAVTLTGISILRVRDGKIVEDRVRADMAGLAQQIGPPPKIH